MVVQLGMAAHEALGNAEVPRSEDLWHYAACRGYAMGPLCRLLNRIAFCDVIELYEVMNERGFMAATTQKHAKTDRSSNKLKYAQIEDMNMKRRSCSVSPQHGFVVTIALDGGIRPMLD